MKMKIKYILSFAILTTSIAPITISITSCSNSHHTRLTRDDWEEQTKSSINQVLTNYGIDGKNYSKDNYVVFDFDNTTSIFDVQHACTTYQIETMAYNLTKDQLIEVLSSDLGDVHKELTKYDFTYSDLIGDIATCYSNLLNKYGPFSYKGVDESKLDQLHKENDWIDFSAKLRYMYSVVASIEGDKIRGKWSTYQFSGMSPEQVYDLEYNCLKHNIDKKSYSETWTAKTIITNSNTIAKASFTHGISVSDNIKELYKAIKDNGIDIWIVSASQIDQIRAAVDIFGLGQYVSGALALTNKIGDDGIYIPQYDTNGKGYIKKDNKWVMMDKSNPHHTSGIGKSETIVDVIAPKYNNKGPIMCFGDSTGDFNFCSEFKDTKLVVCFNRADRSVTDGGGLMSAIAIYQKENNITLEKANANNDTLYCLQGRDDNKRIFRNSNKTIKLGSNEESLFLNSKNYTLLSYIKDNKLSIKEACKLCLKTTIQGISVGFLDAYIGYHTR